MRCTPIPQPSQSKMGSSLNDSPRRHTPHTVSGAATATTLPHTRTQAYTQAQAHRHRHTGTDTPTRTPLDTMSMDLGAARGMLRSGRTVVTVGMEPVVASVDACYFRHNTHSTLAVAAAAAVWPLEGMPRPTATPVARPVLLQASGRRWWWHSHTATRWQAPRAEQLARQRRVRPWRWLPHAWLRRHRTATAAPAHVATTVWRCAGVGWLCGRCGERLRRC